MCKAEGLVGEAMFTKFIFRLEDVSWKFEEVGRGERGVRGLTETILLSGQTGLEGRTIHLTCFPGR